MPRIDPQQLLTCLSVLLSPTGGILSRDVVQRLANLMTKFSKKLVSKCVYVLILKNTDQQLLDSFMAEGGWSLVYTWIQDAYQNRNWALVTELLELLLLTRVDVGRLKSNSLPKLVKVLSKREDLDGIHELASQLVQQWLQIVKDETQADNSNQPSSQPEPLQTVVAVVASEPAYSAPTELQSVVESEDLETTDCYKLAVRDGKHILCKVSPSEANVTVVANAVIEEVKAEDIKLDDEDGRRDDKLKENKDKSRDKDRRRSSSSSKNSSRDKEKSSSSSSNSSNSKSSRDKDRTSSSRSKDRRDRDRDKHRSNGTIKSSSKTSSSGSSKDRKEKQAEKDKDTLAKIQPQSLNKLGRIPKKSSDEKSKDKDDEKKKQGSEKKPLMGIETKNPNEPRPKTVKVYNSKMRSTGLMEEAKPPPPRPVKKAASIPANIPLKRSSPVRDQIPPPEKKPKVEIPERPGSIKLIPPKPKPPVLLESDIFMDALNASASSKKEPKKRKRRPSVNKESTGSPPTSPSGHTPTTPTSPTTSSSLNFKSITPANFYQDTLESNNDDDRSEEAGGNTPTSGAESDEKPETTTYEPPPKVEKPGIKGVLLYAKKKGPKRSIKWKPDNELVDVQYFELDETERVNVTRAFLDMAKMEMSGEREMLKSRKLSNEDVMDVQTLWTGLIEIDMKPALAEPGSKSLEKDIQFAREKSILQALYFGGKMAQETPTEPDLENHQMTDPVAIPLEDPENPEGEAVVPPWPEPKGSPPPQNLQNMQNMQMFAGPFPNFPPPNFQTMPFAAPAANFMAPGMMPQTDNWGAGPRMPPPEMMNQPNGPLFPAPDFPNVADNQSFPPMFNQNMFPNNFHVNRGRGGGFRGRGMGNGPWVRMNGPGPGAWNHPGGGRGGNVSRGGRVCKNVKNHGYCRNRDSCPFYHPN